MEFFRTALAVFTCKWYYLCAYFSPDSDKIFPLEIYIFTAVLLIEVKTHLKAKVLNILTMDLFLSFSPHKMLTERLELCGLLWCFNQLFRPSFWRHPFTAEDSLVSKWCNTISPNLSDEEGNSSTSRMTWKWVNVKEILISVWTIFNAKFVFVKKEQY